METKPTAQFIAACERLGWAELARRCGVSTQAAHKWRQRVPPGRVRGVLEALGDKVTPHDATPYLYPKGFRFARVATVEPDSVDA